MIVRYFGIFLMGAFFTLFIGSYAISRLFDLIIKEDKLMDELIAENEKYKEWYQKMNEDYWG